MEIFTSTETILKLQGTTLLLELHLKWRRLSSFLDIFYKLLERQVL